MKAAKTRALHKKHPVHAHHGGAVAKKPAAKAKKAPKATAAKKAPVRRTAAQVKAAHNRAWSPGGVSCCAAEALAASLRLAGYSVAGGDVLALYRLTADSPDEGASILVTLEAAAEHGLAVAGPGTQATYAGLAIPDHRSLILGADAPGPRTVRLVRFEPVDLDDPAAVILGLDLPEAPHAVALDPSGAVWSWGALYDLTGEAVIAEAWAVEWPLASRLQQPAYCASEV